MKNIYISDVRRKKNRTYVLIVLGLWNERFIGDDYPEEY